MNLPQLIEAYGYWAVLGGTLLEGESVLLLAGFAAHRGYLELHTVIGVAVIGSFLGDQLWFYLGRRHGSKLLQRYPRYAAQAARAQELLLKWDTPVILSVRFLYGLRTVLPFVIGMSTISMLRFQVLNFAGAILWAILGAGAGYLFGNAVEVVLGDLHRYEKYILAFIAVASLAYWWYSRRRRA